MAAEDTKNAIKSLKRELRICLPENKREIGRLLILCYYNKSVEEDHLQFYNNSIRSLENGLVLAENIFGLEDQLTLELAKEYKKIEVSINRKKKLLKKHEILTLQRKEERRDLGFDKLNIEDLRQILNCIPRELKGWNPEPSNNDHHAISVEEGGNNTNNNKRGKKPITLRLESKIIEDEEDEERTVPKYLGQDNKSKRNLLNKS